MDMKASLVLKMSWIRDIAKTCKYHQHHQHYSHKKQARSGLSKARERKKELEGNVMEMMLNMMIYELVFVGHD